MARRIAAERTLRGWSYADLAGRLAEAGCPIAQSAIFKIEKGTPRRKITVDEAVAFARVLGIELTDLLGVNEIAETMATLTPRALAAELDALMAELNDVGEQREMAAKAEAEAREQANTLRQRQLNIEVRIAVKRSQLGMLSQPDEGEQS